MVEQLSGPQESPGESGHLLVEHRISGLVFGEGSHNLLLPGRHHPQKDVAQTLSADSYFGLGRVLTCTNTA